MDAERLTGTPAPHSLSLTSCWSADARGQLIHELCSSQQDNPLYLAGGGPPARILKVNVGTTQPSSLTITRCCNLQDEVIVIYLEGLITCSCYRSCCEFTLIEVNHLLSLTVCCEKPYFVPHSWKVSQIDSSGEEEELRQASEKAISHTLFLKHISLLCQTWPFQPAVQHLLNVIELLMPRPPSGPDLRCSSAKHCGTELGIAGNCRAVCDTGTRAPSLKTIDKSVRWAKISPRSAAVHHKPPVSLFGKHQRFFSIRLPPETTAADSRAYLADAFNLLLGSARGGRRRLSLSGDVNS
ncbi:hypothetical protein IRJ41_014983 [Triplophysa rosa]|uniref:Uncharacterized protein n=1 Tax=Triplophysa rosa TaxID=992332 RepID=A0A9W7TBT6_TRIRA|nr:hypothetical protein IRJ41_014983 [Triplophysa rosa]